ncbi:4-hydroxy-3-methylbut-2-en-1-yl diphosphate synthase (ferredoxin), chloroplastic-like [Hibiscus syriacus]|uniref:4-hydroxy-3-methylbut-2-en-1-yl diphosphate synthase (ferredoxin), chloroplastic-like n=1 Tax=Hibiscus syriacus TaxID=106335 RepID=UPI001920B584|nr:4-hydroxy-3-methylbut-2-en-1-yl diphosphate synthase (ferredoxin), chloroplastic-like [Hibiscus syriacus]
MAGIIHYIWESLKLEKVRMKSAIGIGTLLQDGLGDTIRVSLTEPPEEEIDPCRRMANLGMKAAELQQGVAGFGNID